MCPHCSGQLQAEPERVLCLGCGTPFAVHDGVTLLARVGTSAGWGQAGDSETSSKAYQQQYQAFGEAAAYNAAYAQKPLKRMSTVREFRILRRLLGAQGRSAAVLHLPCGGGRLSPQIAPFTDLIVEADIALGQVLYGKRGTTLNTPRVWMTASAFHIPFRDGSVDGTICCRLCHHLPTANERERLVRELLRVSKRFVIMTFFDYHSTKNILRRIRRPFNHKPPKMTMTVARVRELAVENGARLVQYPWLAAISSGHRYALMVKDS